MRLEHPQSFLIPTLSAQDRDTEVGREVGVGLTRGCRPTLFYHHREAQNSEASKIPELNLGPPDAEADIFVRVYS